MSQTTAFSGFIDALRDNGRNVTESSPAKAIAQCPAHDDGKASLSITGIEGQVLVYCHAGCDTPAVVEALGLTMANLFDDRNGARYDYPDGRRSHRTPDKQFRQSGNTQGTSLFHADHIGDASLVYVVEGEKDVLAVEAAGAVAVCSAMGAGKAHKFDWSPLAGRRVIIVADRDEPGRKHAAQVAEHLGGIVASMKVVEAAVGKDAADHIAAGRSLDELVTAVRPAAASEPTSWETVDLGPWLRGEHRSPQPIVGIPRSDGQKVLYPGREHAVVGETESGKSWFALGCVSVELCMGRDVLYIHYEEGDPASTIERLLLLGVPAVEITDHLRFVSPVKPAQADWLEALLDPPPVLVVHDGVNEAMSLHGADIMAADGAATFRRRLIQPCLRAGAATLACDHVPKSAEGRGRDAYGSVHKGNALDGARIVLENTEPFGRGLRGASKVFVTKDRPGQLRAHGKPTGMSGKTFYGMLVVDDGPLAGPDFLAFYAPKDNDQADVECRDSAAEMADAVYGVIATMPEGTVESTRQLFAALRRAEIEFSDSAARDALEDLLLSGQLKKVPGKNNAHGYKAVSSASDPATQSGASPSASRGASSIENDAPPHTPDQVRRDARRTPTHSDAPTQLACRYCGENLAEHMTSQRARGYCHRAACQAAANGGAA